MAVVNINLDDLNMETMPEAYTQIVSAIEERLTIIWALASNLDYYYGNWAGWPNWQLPYGQFIIDEFFRYGVNAKFQFNSAKQMNSLLFCIYKISKFFVNPEGDPFTDSYVTFPHSCKDAVVSDIERNIGTSIAQFDSFAQPTMESWRKLFQIAVYWLNKFTMIPVPSHARCVTQRGRYSGYDGGPVPVTEIEPASNDPSLEATYIKTQTNDQEDPSITRTLRGYFGLKVQNRTPYAGVCKLYACLPSVNVSSGTNWKSTDKWQHFTRKVVTDENPWQPDPDDPDTLYPGNTTETERTYVLLNGAWVMKNDLTKEIEWSHNQYGNNDNFQWTRNDSETYKNFSPDGSNEIVLDQTSAYYGQDQSIQKTNFRNEITITDVNLWDGFGIWSSIGTPVTESIPAHTEQKLNCFTFSDIPEPENKSNFEDFSGDGYQRGEHGWSESWRLTFNLRVVPFLDFANSITTFSIVEASEGAIESDSSDFAPTD